MVVLILIVSCFCMVRFSTGMPGFREKRGAALHVDVQGFLVNSTAPRNFQLIILIWMFLLSKSSRKCIMTRLKATDGLPGLIDFSIHPIFNTIQHNSTKRSQFPFLVGEIRSVFSFNNAIRSFELWPTYKLLSRLLEALELAFWFSFDLMLELGLSNSHVLNYILIVACKSQRNGHKIFL